VVVVNIQNGDIGILVEVDSNEMVVVEVGILELAETAEVDGC
jgi:hypothetical protein